MKQFHMLSFLLLIIAGVNTLAIGLFKWEIADLFGGQSQMITRVIYIVLGLAAVAEIAMHKKTCRCCNAEQPAL